MHITSRSYLTAGVAALGAGAIALTPVQPLPAHVALAPSRVVSDLSVQLAGAIDPITPIFQTIGASIYDTKQLISQWSAGLYVDGVIPMPPNTGTGIGGNGNLGYVTGGYATGTAFSFIQQVLSNQLVYLSELPAIGPILQQELKNVVNAVKAPIKPGEEQEGRLVGPLAILGKLSFNQNISAKPLVSLGELGTLSQRDVVAALPILAGDLAAKLAPVIAIASTPISGVLLGAIGPVLGPVIQAVDSVKAIFAELKAKNFPGAINELINIPTKMVSAALVGGPTLDLTKIVKGLLPETVQSIGIKMGGLLSPGGVAIDGIAATAGLGDLVINDPGLPVGPIGSLARLTGYVANSVKVPLPTSGAVRKPRSAAVEGRQAKAAASRAGKATAGSAAARGPKAAAARHAR